MPWLLNVAYLALIVGLFPVWIYRRWVLGKRFGDVGQKLWGRLPLGDGQPCVWLHAVSVGEVIQLEPVLALLAQQRPDHRFLITTTTTTGYDVAVKRYPQHQVAYFPLDFTWAVSAALDRVQPAAIVLVELELWPNFILTAAARNIPIVLINGRISDKSFGSYQWIRPLTRLLLGNLTRIAAQNATYASRFQNLGANPARLTITGSIKFDRVETRRDHPRTGELRQSFGLLPDEQVFIAGSTQAPEEEYALQTWRALRDKYPQLRLILVPRHKERFDEVARLVENQQLPLLRRSLLKNGGISSTASASSRPILLLDTLGELSACWGLADIAFVGGSLTRRGGQNMIEPAGYGAALLFGPHTHNFRDVVAALLEADAARVVQNSEELTAAVSHWLAHPAEAASMGQRAQALVLSQQGATAQTVAQILPSLANARQRRAA